MLGDEKQCKKDLELSKDMEIEATGEEKEKALKQLNEESEKSLEGFRGIFE